MSTIKHITAISLLCYLLAGCGQTGPLYLPASPDKPINETHHDTQS